MKNDIIKKGDNNFKKTLNFLSNRKEVPKSAYVLILLIYIITSVLLARVARSTQMIKILDMEVPIVIFTGVFSPLANMCTIVLVVLFKKIGYITSMGIFTLQFPILVMNIFVHKISASIPGFFINFFTVIVITLLFINNWRVDKYQRNIREQAVLDSLTGLPNKFACNELFQDLVKRGIKYCVVYLNINSLKNINDTIGRDAGDRVLAEIADRWKKLADSDASETSVFVSRIISDEFMLIIRGYDSEETVIKTIQDYRSELERKISFDGCDFYMNACFGYAEYMTDSDDVDMLVTCAEATMHEAKRMADTNTILRFKPEHLRAEQTMEIEKKIRTALDNNTLYCCFQPQYGMDKRLRGFEALARMKDSDGKIVSPGDFIPVAEKRGLIDQIDLRVFDMSLAFLEKMIKEKNADFIISFNVSVRHLMKSKFIEEIKDVLNKYDVPSDRIEMEITESIMIDSVEKALECINEIKKLGMQIAIDDFGTGYSSLSYLNSFPADLLKIDKSFIDVMNTTESSKQYVATIIAIGHILNLEVISEGVESDDQIETLKNNGCDFIQGYVWGKPMLPEEAARLIA